MNARERVAEILRNVKALPTLPDVAVKLLEMGESASASAGDMAQLIERDMSLAARVLKLVNSPFFGLRHEVTSIQQALLIVGTAHLRSLVLSGAVSSLFEREGSIGSFNRREFWKHSLAVAAAARSIAAQTDLLDREIAFTAGLIHDIGKVVIDRHLHPEFNQIVHLADERSLPMYEAELEVIGVDHTEIGRHLAVRWNLPEILMDGIACHHNPADSEHHAAAAAVICAANQIAAELNVGSSGGTHRPQHDQFLGLCGLTEHDYDELKQQLGEILVDRVEALAVA
jgi:putative nucleotidyltransferase with HDIG domain